MNTLTNDIEVIDLRDYLSEEDIAEMSAKLNEVIRLCKE